ncbi:unnamed protein product [Urochloa humidicola]
MNESSSPLSLLSWNVRGLGDPDKCKLVRDTLSTPFLDVACLQETKLDATTTAKARSFLPSSLSDYLCVDACETRGGLITAWNTRTLQMDSFISHQRTLTMFFSSTMSDACFAVTNVYAPADHRASLDFLEDLEALARSVTGRWVILGDFNLTRGADENSNGNSNRALSDAFNECINTLGLIDIPLLDRLYTWSNHRETPTLARLDRAFLNTAMSTTYPNSVLTSLPKPTSDHTPILLKISTEIPKPNLFRFENAWLKHSDFLPSVLSAWNVDVPAGATATLVRLLKSVRCASKRWARCKRAPPSLHFNCKFVIYMLDVLEEGRLLSAGERFLRQACQERLALSLRERAAYWKQRGKHRAIREGDSNTRFFHAHASARLRRNTIRSVEADGATVTSHEGKTRAFTNHLRQLLGEQPGASPTTFDVHHLYADAPKVNTAPLIAPFTEQEAWAAVRGMNRNSSPGPDGFGPGFYCAAWNTVAPAVMAMAHAFQTGDAELDRLNRAFIVLIPKVPVPVKPGDYRPICLQNCSLKIVAKMLTTRLQREIPKLIDLDQTGFIRGRSIAENFIYALELIQCCHRRKLPTLVLKLDFAKAFDTVSWDSLDATMAARGFPQEWCCWIREMLHTSKLAVLVNGRPGTWFPCKRGVRQGDPLSPYLFLLVADVLQQMIKQDGGIRHPAAADVPCPVLQYADDTLILLKADCQDLQRLKATLEQFSEFTGLKINYSKSTVTPMHVPDGDTTMLQAVLGCQLGTFPQTYLGLPLSNDKLRLSAFTPLVAKADKYLSGWQASLLNPMGRTVLVNTVLDSQLIHAMSVVLLPQGILDAFDRRRRAFLWSGEETVSGAQCLVAWEQACLPKEQGGLGIKNIALQNKCLLLKLLHRLHQPGESAWANWVRDKINLVTFHGDVVGAHWQDLADLLPLYRAVTVCEVYNGESTNFWLDRWLSAGRLQSLFPLLASHSTSLEVTVAQIVTDGIQQHLMPRLTRAALEELVKLQTLLTQVALRDGEDRRSSALADADGILRTGPVYKQMVHSTGPPPKSFSNFVWGNRAPPRVQFFAWLLVQERIQCRSNLVKKNVLQDARCPLCPSEEDPNHIIFGCPFAQQAWLQMGFDITGCTVRTLWEVPRPATVPAKHYNSFLLLITWHLWKHRNTVVFDAAAASHSRLWASSREDARLWSQRWAQDERHIAEFWCSLLSPM